MRTNEENLCFYDWGGFCYPFKVSLAGYFLPTTFPIQIIYEKSIQVKVDLETLRFRHFESRANNFLHNFVFFDCDDSSDFAVHYL